MRLLAVLLVITWTIAGFALGLIGGTEFLLFSGMPNKEGYPAMLAFMGFSPIGALAGLIAGIWVARAWRDNLRRLQIAAGVPLSAFAVVAVVAVLDGYRNSPPPERHVYALFTVELRLPAGVPVPAREDMFVELRHDKPDETMTASFYPGDWDRRRDGDLVVVQGFIDTWSRNTNRTIAVRAGNGATHLFKINEPPEPEDTKFTAWRQADSVEPAGAPPRAAKPREDIEFRYKVDKKY
jgi:hypothetical protein